MSTATGSTTEENLTSSVENITDSIFVEASESFNQSITQDEVDPVRVPDSELTGEEQIIRQMDHDLPASSSRSNESFVRRRTFAQPETEVESSSSAEAENSQQKEEDKISIKLKYLNDEIKTVNAYLNETIGNFKR